VKRGGNGIYSVITANSTSKTLYNSGERTSLPGELLAHEMLGHGLGNRLTRRDASQLDASIQAGNTYLRTQGTNYFRTNHGLSNHSKGFNPNMIPSYLRSFPYSNF